MKDFMYIFRNTKEAEEAHAKLSPKEMEDEMNGWGEWMSKLAQQGNLVGGQPLFPNGTVIKPGRKITDGPFIEGKDIVGGYLMIKAKDMDEAISLSEGCPVLAMPEGTVEVREIMPMPE